MALLTLTVSPGSPLAQCQSIYRCQKPRKIDRGYQEIKENELHVLFNNGGVMVPPIEQLTEDGYDLQFGTNVVGHYYFTMLLMPVLLAGTETSGDGKARVVNT